MASPGFKRWAVLLSICLAVLPLYGRAKDSVKSAPGTNFMPAQHNAPVAPIPATGKIQPAAMEPDLENDTMELPLDSETVVERQNNPDPQDIPPWEALSVSKKPNKALDSSEYFQGVQDGKRDAKGKPLWILAGLSGSGLCICFGAAGIGLAVSVPYYPASEGLLGKSSHYIDGYIAGYKSMTRWKNAGWAALGFAAAIVIDIALNISITFGNFHFKGPLII